MAAGGDSTVVTSDPAHPQERTESGAGLRDAIGESLSAAWHQPQRRRELVSTLVVLGLPLAIVLIGVILVTQTSDITVRDLTQDSTTVLDGPFYVGSVSNLGNLLWAAGATVCLFTAMALPVALGHGMRRFLTVSGAFTILLMADDALLIHDEILPQHFGISGEIYGLLYIALMLGFLVAFRRLILTTNVILLLTALVFFAGSAGVDMVSSVLSGIISSAAVIFAEDATKLLGIGIWLAYFVAVARQAVREGSGDPVQPEGSGEAPQAG